jgi:hypothetical protein
MIASRTGNCLLDAPNGGIRCTSRANCGLAQPETGKNQRVVPPRHAVVEVAYPLPDCKKTGFGLSRIPARRFPAQNVPAEVIRAAVCSGRVVQLCLKGGLVSCFFRKKIIKIIMRATDPQTLNQGKVPGGKAAHPLSNFNNLQHAGASRKTF